MNAELMTDFEARSDEEQEAFFDELNQIEAVIKELEHDKEDAERFNPLTNYKLTYR